MVVRHGNYRRGGLATRAASVGAAFSPLTDLANLSAWLDPSDASTVTLDGLNAEQVDDKSGSGNHFSQSNVAKKPLYGLAAVNGLNCLQPAGASESMASSFVAPATVSLSVVVKHNNDGQGARGTTWGWNSTNDRLNLFSNAYQLRGPTTAIGGVATTIASITIIYNSVADVDWYIVQSGAELSGSFDPNDTYVGGILTIMNSGNFINETMDGDWCEMAVQSGVMTAAERASWNSYVAAKWGVSIP